MKTVFSSNPSDLLLTLCTIIITITLCFPSNVTCLARQPQQTPRELPVRYLPPTDPAGHQYVTSQPQLHRDLPSILTQKVDFKQRVTPIDDGIDSLVTNEKKLTTARTSVLQQTIPDSSDDDLVSQQVFDSSPSTLNFAPSIPITTPLVTATPKYTDAKSITASSANDKIVPITTNSSSSGVHPLLIYSIRYEIRSYDLFSTPSSKSHNSFNGSSAIIDQHHYAKHSPSKTLIGGLKNTIGLDFYISDKESYIFWTDVIDERIYRGTLANGTITNLEVIVQTGLATAEGLAVDWIGHNIYWVESTLDHIEVANMNGTSRKTLIAGDMESPRAIALDPRYGLLFWTDWDKMMPRIERASMAGDDRKTIVNIKELNGGWPNGLTLDYDALKIYWIDANSDSIHVVDYEGNNHRSLLRKIKSLGHPFSITLFENSLYWTDWKTNSISTANKHNGSEARELQRLSGRLFDIKVLHPDRQPKIPSHMNPCSINNGNCSHLCLLSTNHTRKCECPHLLKLSIDEMTCETYEHVLLIGRTNEIRAVDMSKPLHHIMAPISVPKVFKPHQFEYYAKSKTLYWADSQTNEVKRAPLAGNNIETIIDVIIDVPSGLALDWISGNIYVTSSHGSHSPGKIYVSNLNGEYISTFMDNSQGIISPKSLAIHPPLGLLFCVDENEVGDPLIFMSSMDGSNKRIIASKLTDLRLKNPSNLAMDLELNRVYWINQAVNTSDNASIQYYDINRDQTVTIFDEAEIAIEHKLNPGVLCVDGDYLIISCRGVAESIVRVSKHGVGDPNSRTILKTQSLDQITALKVYNASSQHGTNACDRNNGGCSQLCLPSNATHRTCKCTMGYSINPSNEVECTGKDLFLIFSYNFGMRGISLEPNSPADDYSLPPIHKAFRASSIEYVHRENLIYWVDNDEGSITRINRDTTNHQVIVQGLESEGCVGVDWVAGNIYWLDPYYDIIEVARLNGSHRYVIISGDMDKANGIVVNPLKGYIAWSDIGSVPKIETAKLDGSNRKVLVGTNLTHVDDLAIDYLEDHIYWVDSTLTIIERIKADGTNRELVYNGSSTETAMHHLASIAIYKDYLYVADSQNSGSIFRINKNNIVDTQIIQKNLGDGIRDITIFAEQPLPSPDDNPCVLNNGGCQDLCAYMGEKGKKRCLCSHGKLNSDGVTCKPHDTFLMFSKLTQIDSIHIQDDEPISNAPYPPIIIENRGNIISLTVDYKAQRVIYSDISRDQICSVSFDGKDRRILVEKQSLVEGMAFANDQLYWTSIQDNSISRLNTTSWGERVTIGCKGGNCPIANAEKLIRLANNDKPRGIAIDVCTAYIYWTNWGTNAAIQRASPNSGYKVESIITTNIKVPNGIAIDQKQRKIYWCDARLDKIEIAEMDGTSRVVLIAASPQHPFALAVWKDYVFWTDWLVKGVLRADKYTGQQVVQVKKVAQRPMGIAVAASDSTECPTSPHCSVNNGGCPQNLRCVSYDTVQGPPLIKCVHPSLAMKPIHHENRLLLGGCIDTGNAMMCNDSYRRTINDYLDRYTELTPLQSDNSFVTPESITTRGANDQTTYVSAAQPAPPITVSTTEINSSTVSPPTVTVATSLMTTSTASTTSTTTSTTTPSTSATTITATTNVTSSPTAGIQSSSTLAPTQASLTNASLPPCQMNPTITYPPSTTDSSINSECKGQFKCYLSEKLVCIPSEKRCDGNPDCPSKEDENLCYLSKRGGQQYNLSHETNWYRFVTVILIILAAAIAALFLVFGNRGRRRWFVGTNGAFNHRKMFDDNGTNIEISNPMFEEDDSANLVNCAFSIDLNERTTNFSNPLYERQVLLVNDKNLNS